MMDNASLFFQPDGRHGVQLWEPVIGAFVGVHNLCADSPQHRRQKRSTEIGRHEHYLQSSIRRLHLVL